jgi:hypothetical protein
MLPTYPLGIGSRRGRCPMSSPSGHSSVTCITYVHHMRAYPPPPHPTLWKDVQVVRTWDTVPFGSRCTTTPYWNPQEMEHQGINAHYLFQVCIYSKGQQVVFSYPMVSPKVTATIMTSYNYPMGHHCHSFVSKNG